MHDGHDQPLSIFITKEHSVRETMKQGAPDVTVDLGELLGRGFDSLEQGFEGEEELVAESASAA